MQSAQARVLNITELLDLILQELSPCDLLIKAQRVSKRWKAVINRSPTIQRALFKKASPATSIGKYDMNWILINVVPSFFGRRTELLGQTFLDFKIYDILDSIVDSSFRSRWLEKTASWRAMHVAEPPITTLRWHVERYPPRSTILPAKLPSVVVELQFPEGLRAGDMYDLMLGTMQNHTSRNFIWPGWHRTEKSLGREVDRWVEDQYNNACDEGALLVADMIILDDDNVDFNEADDLWNLTNLEKYHTNLVKFEKREREEETHEDLQSFVAWNLEGSRSLDAMKEFLHETRDKD